MMTADYKKKSKAREKNITDIHGLDLEAIERSRNKKKEEEYKAR